MVSVSTGSGTSPSVSVTLPTGAAGDLLCAWVLIDQNTAPPDPTGWVFGIQDLNSMTLSLYTWSRQRQASDTAFTVSVGSAALVVVVNFSAAELGASGDGHYNANFVGDQNNTHIHSSTSGRPAVWAEWSFSGDVTFGAAFQQIASIGPLTASEHIQVLLQDGTGDVSSASRTVTEVSLMRLGIGAVPSWVPDAGCGDCVPTHVTYGVNMGWDNPSGDLLPTDPPYPQDGLPYAGYGTSGIGLSHNGTRLYYLDDLTFNNLGDPNEYGYSIVAYPSFTHIASYQLIDPSDPDAFAQDLTADNDGNVYFWSFRNGESFPSLIKQNGASWTEMFQDSDGSFGPAWNPYDEMLYDIWEGTLRRYDTTTFAIEVLVDAGVLGARQLNGNQPAFTPDGAIWIAGTDGNPTFNEGLLRYDPATDSLTSAFSPDIPAIDTSGNPFPSPLDGSVYYRSYPNSGGIGVRVLSDLTWEVSTCDPWGDGTLGGGSARLAQANRQHLVIWPTIGGFGSHLWEWSSCGHIGIGVHFGSPNFHVGY